MLKDLLSKAVLNQRLYLLNKLEICQLEICYPGGLTRTNRRFVRSGVTSVTDKSVLNNYSAFLHHD